MAGKPCRRKHRRRGQDNRRIDAEIGRQGSQRLSLGYREMPNHRYDDGVTPFCRDGSGVLLLPTDWSAGTETGQMPLLEASLRDQNIDHERWRLDLSYSRLFGGGWQFDVDYRREVKDGSRLVGGVIGNSGGNRRSALLAAPVDFVTDIVDVSLRYHSDGCQAGLGVQASRFNNRQTSVTWQNPFSAVGGWADGAGFTDGLGRTSLEPDNDFVQARAFGPYDLSPTTRLSATLAAGRMSQNNAFLPYTVNPALDAPLELPRADLDGRTDTLLADVRLSARPLPRLRVSASYRYDDRDNQTPWDLYAPVRGDSLDQVAPEAGRLNLPYSYAEQRFGVDARYRLASRTRLNAA
jgi:MtrB/PioB family decaheme-associated outer membrane protein